MTLPADSSGRHIWMRTARIEVEQHEIEKIAKEEIRNKIVDEFKKIGFNYITLDLQGYRTGSMNETIDIGG